MLFVSWIIVKPEDLPSVTVIDDLSVCLDLRTSVKWTPDLFRCIQSLSPSKKLSVLFPGDDEQSMSESIVQLDLPVLFFQPSYYHVLRTPVVFTEAKSNDPVIMLSRLEYALEKQGYDELEVRTLSADPKAGTFCFFYSEIIDCAEVLNAWLDHTSAPDKLFPIHVFFHHREPETANGLYKLFAAREKQLQSTKPYQIAEKMLSFQTETNFLKDRLHQAEIAEKNHQAYLEFQKKDLSRTLKWYHYEHEILPLWYKQFGHIIKVITGKRTFRSLFSDNVKKYID